MARELTDRERRQLLSLDLHHENVRALLAGYMAAGLEANANVLDGDDEDRTRDVVRHILELFVENLPQLLGQAELVYLMTKGNVGHGEH